MRFITLSARYRSKINSNIVKKAPKSQALHTYWDNHHGSKEPAGGARTAYYLLRIQSTSRYPSDWVFGSAFSLGLVPRCTLYSACRLLALCYNCWVLFPDNLSHRVSVYVVRESAVARNGRMAFVLHDVLKRRLFLSIMNISSIFGDR